ncbi:hybrid sensor histidine kinase/response regulator [Candidatus Leptofilum sp.]|uniref:hybrid sensor histidine kinase/response regulator n=1 Tax=Candidatus Leptofilum sp. TaxID=3241576 RepID=UPI003B596E58
MNNITSQPAKILYIEDDPASRRLVQRVLDNKGYKVVVAADGLEGISMAREHHPNLILMDINLPSMDGREITTRLRSLPNFSNTPIVALTANHSAGNRELALAAGCTGFLTKPIDVTNFPGQVNAYLEGLSDAISSDEKSVHLQKHAQNLVTRLENKIHELESANKRLRELDRLKSDFIIMVSHELRTPLTLISGYAHLLDEQVKQSDDSLPAEMVSGVAEGLNLGVIRMRDVVNEIIKVARIASGTLDLALGPVRLCELVQDVYEEYQDVLEKRNLNVQIGDLEKLPIVQGDGDQLKSAIYHIVSNAIKYTPDGGSIFIVGRAVGDTVNLIIQDSGIGIPDSEHRRIFDQFYTLGSIEHHSTSKFAFQGGGLGLGLAIVKGIIEAHNGRVWVESERRDVTQFPGSTFHILLPLEQVKKPAKL